MRSFLKFKLIFILLIVFYCINGIASTNSMLFMDLLVIIFYFVIFLDGPNFGLIL